MTYHPVWSDLTLGRKQMQQQYEPRFSLQELTEATGVSERTVRYYITEGVIPASRGKGRSAFYTSEHVEALTRVKDLKQLNLSISEIRQAMAEERKPLAAPASGEVWRRIRLHADLELQVRDGAPEHVVAFVQYIQSGAHEWFDHDADEPHSKPDV